jgi:hypothetical protein
MVSLAANNTAPVRDIALFRLYLLRAGYLLLVVGLGPTIWPVVLHHRPWSDVMHGSAVAMLAALSALALLGVRYPLKMLPLLLFELTWKAIFLAAVAYPAWVGGKMDANMSEATFACAMGAIFLLVIPWDHVWATYVKAPGDRWFS